MLWKYKSVDREFYEVAPGETKTTTNVVGLSWRPRPGKGVRLKADYQSPFGGTAGVADILRRVAGPLAALTQ